MRKNFMSILANFFLGQEIHYNYDSSVIST